MIVAIDGPSGTGKSTVTERVAELSGLPHLDTGAFYRAATLAVLREGAQCDEHAVVEVVRSAGLDQRDGGMFLDGEEVSAEIRLEPVTAAVSSVAAIPEVREILVQHQRAWVSERGERAVVEGRDIGSVVFPNADVKIYLDATPEVRAERRAAQTGEQSAAVLADILRRDAFDSERAASPLMVPIGAVVIDTSEMGFDEVVAEVMRHIEAKV
ncbi:MAG: (d)CMP kinase [Actinobacteria bacterium]|nr:(d)CMP kinase [Actinomycetota bacterium]